MKKYIVNFICWGVTAILFIVAVIINLDIFDWALLIYPIYLIYKYVMIYIYNKKYNNLINEDYDKAVDYLKNESTKAIASGTYYYLLAKLLRTYLIRDKIEEISELCSNERKITKLLGMEYYCLLIAIDDRSLPDTTYYYKRLLSRKLFINKNNVNNAISIMKLINNENISLDSINKDLPIIERICNDAAYNGISLSDKISACDSSLPIKKKSPWNIIIPVACLFTPMLLGLILGLLDMTLGSTIVERYYHLSSNMWLFLVFAIIPAAGIIIYVIWGKTRRLKLEFFSSIFFLILFLIFASFQESSLAEFDRSEESIIYIEEKLQIDLPSDTTALRRISADKPKYGPAVIEKDITLFLNKDLDESIFDNANFKSSLSNEDLKHIPSTFKEDSEKCTYFSIICLDTNKFFDYSDTKGKLYLIAAYDPTVDKLIAQEYTLVI